MGRVAVCLHPADDGLLFNHLENGTQPKCPLSCGRHHGAGVDHWCCSMRDRPNSGCCFCCCNCCLICDAFPTMTSLTARHLANAVGNICPVAPNAPTASACVQHPVPAAAGVRAAFNAEAEAQFRDPTCVSVRRMRADSETYIHNYPRKFRRPGHDTTATRVDARRLQFRQLGFRATTEAKELKRTRSHNVAKPRH